MINSIFLLFCLLLLFACGNQKNISFIEYDEIIPTNHSIYYNPGNSSLSGSKQVEKDRQKAFKKTKKELKREEKRKKKFVEKAYRIHRKNQIRKTKKTMKKETRKMVRDRNKKYRKYS